MHHRHIKAGAVAVALAGALASAEPVWFLGPLDQTSYPVTTLDVTAAADMQFDDFGTSVFYYTHAVGGGQTDTYLESTFDDPGTGLGRDILQLGNSIDAGLNWRHSGPNRVSLLLMTIRNIPGAEPNYSVMDPGETGYAAVSFVRDDGLHYGWIEIRNTSRPDQNLWGYQISAWGYETLAGVAIAAGAGVPAPGALVCMGLATAVVTRRRR